MTENRKIFIEKVLDKSGQKVGKKWAICPLFLGTKNFFDNFFRKMAKKVGICPLLKSKVGRRKTL